MAVFSEPLVPIWTAGHVYGVPAAFAEKSLSPSVVSHSLLLTGQMDAGCRTYRLLRVGAMSGKSSQRVS